MAKLKPDPITHADFIDFLDGHSDFAFEVKTLNALIGLGFTCDHAGTYDDPSTQKPREYDIRATRQIGKRFLRLAVECKNLRTNFPLLISCLPRRTDEAFHEVVYSVSSNRKAFQAFGGRSKTFRIAGADSLYPAGDPAGKSCDQVGRSNHNGEIISGDSGVYDKWAQALSSADELTYLACSDGEARTGDIAYSLVFPLVVVPDGRLWWTLYHTDGSRVSDPEPTDRCSYFVNRPYVHRNPPGDDRLVISHLEFVTSNGLLELVHDLCGDDTALGASFQTQWIIERMA